MNFKSVMILAVFLSVTTASQAAYITIDEVGMDTIFSQPNFGNTPIDIRIGKPQGLVRPDFLEIDSSSRLQGLFGHHFGSFDVVNFFFVDQISYCSTYNPLIVGCGELPGNSSVVESNYADTVNNAELLSHELGHNLSLAHIYGAEYLMNPFINGGTFLTEFEVSRIFSSFLVKQDSLGWFIDIEPILVVAQAARVPEPGMPALMLSGLLALYFRRRHFSKRHRTSTS